MTSYFKNVFSETSWNEFLAHGETKGSYITGFPERYRKWAKRVRTGDKFICYLGKGTKRICGLLEAKSEAFYDTKRIWADDTYPIRFEVNPIIIFEDTNLCIPFKPLWHQTEDFKRRLNAGKATNLWGHYWIRSFGEIPSSDGRMFENAIREQQKSLVATPIPEKRKYERKSRSKSRESVKNQHMALRDKLENLIAMQHDGLITQEQYRSVSNKMLEKYYLQS